jgi:hypothetical protein
MTITHARGAATDGTDSVRNVERLQFSDQIVTIRPVAALTPATRTFATRQIATTSAAQPVTLTNTGNSPLAIASIALTGTDPGDFAISANTCAASLGAGASCTIGTTFRPTAAGTRTAILRATDDSNGTPGSTQDVTLTGVGTVGPPPNSPATGAPVISDATPQILQTLTVNTSAIADADGLGTLQFRWQQTNNAGTGAFTNIAGATNPSFTVPLLGAGRRFQVVVSFVDGAGHAETVTSAPTARASILPNATTAPTAAAAAVPAGPAARTAPATAAPAAPAPAVLRASALTVRAAGTAPLTVAANVPAGATTARITVSRLTRPAKGSPAARRRVRAKVIATVFRTVSQGRRVTFRLTEKPLRNLRAGRYRVEVRVGRSRGDLGPATTREVTVRSSRATSAR